MLELRKLGSSIFSGAGSLNRIHLRFALYLTSSVVQLKRLTCNHSFNAPDMTRDNNATKERLLTTLRKVGLIFAPLTRCLKPSRRGYRNQAQSENCEKSSTQGPGQTANDGRVQPRTSTASATTDSTKTDPSDTKVKPKEVKGFGRTTVTGPGATIHLVAKKDPSVNPIDVSPVNHDTGSGLATRPDESSKHIDTDPETRRREFRYLDECDPEIKARRIKDQGQRQKDDFSNSGNIHSLEEAIKCFREAGDLLRHTSSDDRIFVLSDLAVVLRLHHNHTRNPDSLAKAIETLREAIQLQPANHSSVAVLKNSLALALSADFDQSGDTSALIEAIELQKDLVRLSPESQCFGPLTHLATSLAKKFLVTGDEEALIQSIDCHREALKLIPHDDPDHLSPLIELATVLAKRFEGIHDIEAQLKSINGLRQELLPPEGRDSLLGDLSQALGKYFEQTRGGSGAEVRIPTSPVGDRV